MNVTRLLVATLYIGSALLAQSGEIDAERIQDLPVLEAMVFKDGHSFVLHEGLLPVGEDGTVTLDRLPRPAMGTFWPHAVDDDVELTSVTTGRRTVVSAHNASTITQLVAANPGAEVVITEQDGKQYAGKLREVPDVKGRGKASYVLIETIEGTKALPLNRVRDVTFRGDHVLTHDVSESKDVMTLALERKGGKLREKEKIGMSYLQAGLRWIPSYHVDIDAVTEGRVRVRLKATLINDLVDLKDTALHLVIGVPKFDYSDTVDPIALQAVAAAAAQNISFPNNRISNFANNISNGMMTQLPGYSSGQVADVTPEGGTGQGHEDLWVYTLEKITLRKGERMVVPVVEFDLAYEDIYRLEIMHTPPREVSRHRGSSRDELARLAAAPKAMHKLRMKNDSGQPLTTAPALVLKKGRVIAQGTMTYTAIGASTDLPLTVAINLRVSHSEKERERVPDAIRFGGHDYNRIAYDGCISLANHAPRPAKVEIVRYVLGQVEEVMSGGKGEAISAFEGTPDFHPGAMPTWWGHYSWPGWWHHVNGVGRIVFESELKVGEAKTFDYRWYYYWR